MMCNSAEQGSGQGRALCTAETEKHHDRSCILLFVLEQGCLHLVENARLVEEDEPGGMSSSARLWVAFSALRRAFLQPGDGDLQIAPHLLRDVDYFVCCLARI